MPGAIAAVADICHPVSLARQVMERTDHCLLVGEGAQRFAQECGIPVENPAGFITEAARNEWEKYRKYKHAVGSLFNNKWVDVCFPYIELFKKIILSIFTE